MKAKDPLLKAVITVVGAILLVALACPLAQGQQPGGRLVRMVTPPSWQAADVQWSRDVQPHNKIDDTIDNSNLQVFDVVVNFKSCPTASDTSALSNLGTNLIHLKYLSTIALGGVVKSNVSQIAAMTNVAFVEQQIGFSPSLTVSVPSMCVTPGSVSCGGNVRALGYDGTGVNIAIIDTGVDTTHNAFAATPIIGQYNAITRTFGNAPDDVGHGTHVASIALGQATINEGEGVAPHAGLIAVKVLDAATTLCSSSAVSWPRIVDGLQTVYDQHQSGVWTVNVINMSLGQCNAAGPVTSDGTDAFSQLANLAESMGIVVVAAAGNNGPANVGLTTPAAATRAITVAAAQTQNTTTRADETIACFSSRGPRADDHNLDPLDELKPEVAAPGTHIFSCVTFTGTGILAAQANSATHNGAVRMSGTSMAAPHVAGLAALIIQAKPGINAASVKQLIIDTATAPDGTRQAAWHADSGYGYVNGFAAVSTVALADLTFPHPAEACCDSPDLSNSPFPARVGMNNTATAMIQNLGPNDAFNVRVNFGIWDFSATTPTFQSIGSVVLPVVLAGAAPVAAHIDWFPVNPSHKCIKVEIAYGADTDFSNNNAQKNLDVQASPVHFDVQNTYSEAPAAIHLVPTLGTNVPGTNWTFTLQPSTVTLGANDCPVQASAELFPGPNVQPGEQQTLRIDAIVDTFFGPVFLGGVTIVGSKPKQDTNTFLPTYRVVQYGATPSQAASLARSLNLGTNQLVLDNGDISFIDPAGFAAPPTAPVTDPVVISNLLAQTKNPYPNIPIRFEQIDFGTWGNMTVLSSNAALLSAAAAFANANLIPQMGTPAVSHATLTAFYTNDNNTVVSNSAYLDTEVNYSLSVDAGYPLVGPGAQVQVAYGSTGNVTRLVYAAPLLTPGSSVQIISPSVVSNRAARIWDPLGLLRPQIIPKIVYFVPHWPWPPCFQCPPIDVTNFVLPWYECSGTLNVTNPVDNQVSAVDLMPIFIPATDDANFVPAAFLEAGTVGGTQVVASVTVTGGQPPYSYSWSGSSSAIASNTGPTVAYSPEVRAAPPPLAIALGNPGSVVVSWPDPSTGFVLESTPKVVGGTWAQVTGPVQTNNGVQSMTVVIDGNSARFFRMRYVSQTAAETVGVTVTDANGVSIQASQALIVIPHPVPPVPPVGDSWGLEDPWTPGIAAACSAAFNAGMVGCGGGGPTFWWKDGASWVGDFIDPPVPHVLPPIPWVNGDDDFANWGVDTANLVLYIGHGAPNCVTFTWPPPPMGPLSTLFFNNPKLPRSWGDDVAPFPTCQWLNFYSCEVMAPLFAGLTCPQRWGRAFDGLHIMTGYKTPALVNPPFPLRFARNVLGCPPVPMPIRIAWRNAALATGTGQPAEMGPIGIGGVTDINDFYWGKGPVGPTIRWFNIRGWWYLDP